jgi:LIVCS family branched-chain amino acid:cation transporter
MTIKQRLSLLPLVLSSGFAIFAMFFGSGNLVFPLILGSSTAGYYLPAALGLLLTGIFIPFFGLYAIWLFNGSYEKFFLRLGKWPTIILPFLILALIGPFGVIPRCITVAHGSVAALLPEFPLWLFSLLLCVITYFIVLDGKRLIPIIGSTLTPILLISLAIIIFYALTHPQSSMAVNPYLSTPLAFTSGILQGYQTMDLLAAFFFASVIIHYIERKIEEGCKDVKTKNRAILYSIVLGAGLLGIIYIAFVYLGMMYSDVLDPQQAEQSLAIIAKQTLGNTSGMLVAVAVFLTCFTTAAALTSVATKFFYQRVFRRKISYKSTVILILSVSFVISNFKFNGIAAFLSPILQALYPGLIALTICNILYKLFPSKLFTRLSVYSTFIVATVFMVIR